MNQCSVTYFSKAFLTLKCRLWGKQVWAVLAKGHQASTTLERNFSRQALLGFFVTASQFYKVVLVRVSLPLSGKKFFLRPPWPLRAAGGRGDGGCHVCCWDGQLWLSPLLLSPWVWGLGSVSSSHGAEQPAGVACPLLPTEQRLQKDQGTAGMQWEHCSDISFSNICCTQGEAWRKMLK